MGRSRLTAQGAKQILTDREVREKLIARGIESLSDSEVLSLLLQSGTQSESTTELAVRVLEHSDGTLAELSMLDLRELRMVEGLGIKRAATISAALELGRRVALEHATTPHTIESDEDIVAMFRPRIAGLDYEEFWVVYLSSANSVLDSTKVSQGGASGTVVDQKLIVKRAVELLASRLILVHNHPSGIGQPSEEDKTLTRKTIDAASLFDIVVLDHLIITSAECFSFRKSGLIE